MTHRHHGFARDFAAGVLFFGVPYGLAVLVQDGLASAAARAHSTVLAAAALGAAAIVLAGVAIWRRRRSRPVVVRHTEGDAIALAMSRPGIHAAEDAELTDAVGHLVTLVRWLQREMDVPVAPDVMRHRIERLAAYAEHVDAVGHGVANGRSRQGRPRRDRGARPGTEASRRRIDESNLAMIAHRG